MSRGLQGYERPPAWATVVMVVGALALVFGLVFSDSLQRGQAADPTPAPESTEAGDAEVVPPLDQFRTDGTLSVYYIGDSLTDGWNATVQERGFRPVLTAALEADGPVAESSDYQAGANLAEVAAQATLPTAVDVAVIELGTNDVSDETELATFQTEYAALTGQIADVSSRLVCLGTFRTTDFASRYDDVIRSSCSAAGGRYVELRSVAASPELIAADGVPAYPTPGDGGHPNDAGHQRIADLVNQALVAD